MKSRAKTWIIGFCIPMAAIILAFPFYNRIEPYVLGFPFVYFWLFVWLFLTSLCLTIAFRIDPYNTKEAVEATDALLKKAKLELAADEANMIAGTYQGGGQQ